MANEIQGTFRDIISLAHRECSRSKQGGKRDDVRCPSVQTAKMLSHCPNLVSAKHDLAECDEAVRWFCGAYQTGVRLE